MANRGVPLQDLKEMMRHSKIETTNKYYVFNNQERIKLSYKNHAAQIFYKKKGGMAFIINAYSLCKKLNF